MKTQHIKDVILAVIFLLLLSPVIIYLFPFVVGADNSYTVVSGSMTPALRLGDLVVVRSGEPIDIGDMVTVKTREFIYTHRVVEKLDRNRFRLKGDANEQPDQKPVDASQIIGKVVLVLPFGYLFTLHGFILATFVPAGIIIGKHMHTIYKLTKRKSKRETMKMRRKSSLLVDKSTILLTLILALSVSRIIAPHFITGSASYFSDVERTTSFFEAGVWEIYLPVDIDPDRLNLKSQVRWITAYIEIDNGGEDIAVGSIMLDEGIPAECWEVQEDGFLQVKFNRTLVTDYIRSVGCEDGDQVNLAVTGIINGIDFTGEDIIEVIDR